METVEETGLEQGDKMNSVLDMLDFIRLSNIKRSLEATDYIGLEFGAGLWARDKNLEVLCIWVITKAKKLNEIM